MQLRKLLQDAGLRDLEREATYRQDRSSQDTEETGNFSGTKKLPRAGAAKSDALGGACLPLSEPSFAGVRSTGQPPTVCIASVHVPHHEDLVVRGVGSCRSKSRYWPASLGPSQYHSRFQSFSRSAPVRGTARSTKRRGS
jgi:hypothetical protein